MGVPYDYVTEAVVLIALALSAIVTAINHANFSAISSKFVRACTFDFPELHNDLLPKVLI